MADATRHRKPDELENPDLSHPNELFAEPVPETRQFPVVPLALAGVAILLVIAALFVAGRHKSSGAGNTLQPAAPYAAQLHLGNLQMSESTSFSGGKSTFIDGTVTNAGSSTVTGITVQVLFGQLSGGAPQLETTPLSLIRTRQPYVDTQPVSAAPLAPGGSAEFRLIFEGIRPDWNQQLPEIRITGLDLR